MSAEEGGLVTEPGSEAQVVHLEAAQVGRKGGTTTVEEVDLLHGMLRGRLGAPAA